MKQNRIRQPRRHVEYRGSLNQEDNPALNRFPVRLRIGAWMGITALGFIKLGDKKGVLRHHVPEPFDYFNHAGNTMNSMVAGALVTNFVNRITPESGRFAFLHSRKFAAAAGMLAVTAINVMAETRLGGGRWGTEDPIDLAYGMVAGAFGVNCATTFDKLIHEQTEPPQGMDKT